jgi:hypothetical protein
MYFAIGLIIFYILVIAALALALVFFVAKRLEDKKKETFEKRDN